jgi:hypothetical protein
MQDELESIDERDYMHDHEQFQNQYFAVKVKINEPLHPLMSPPCSRHSSGSGSHHSANLSNHTRSSHSDNTHIKLSVIALPAFDGNVCSWLHFRDTFDAPVVKNTQFTNVQRFHYFISAFKGEAKELISNLPITNDNVMVAWQLVTQCYNNVKLIAMMHAKHLWKMPQVTKGDAFELHTLINHIHSHMNALQALSLNVPMQDLILNHMT